MFWLDIGLCSLFEGIQSVASCGRQAVKTSHVYRLGFRPPIRGDCLGEALAKDAVASGVNSEDVDEGLRAVATALLEAISTPLESSSSQSRALVIVSMIPRYSR